MVNSVIISSIVAILLGLILALIVWFSTIAPNKKPDVSLPKEIISV